MENVVNIELKQCFLAVALNKGNSKGKDIIQKISTCPNIEKIVRTCAIFDAEIDIKNVSKMMWKIFNNTDPSRDILQIASLVLIDACKKNLADGHNREWPDDLSFDK